MSSIKLKHSGGNSVSLNPPTSAPTSSEVAFKLPNADGSVLINYMKTDGSGNLAFATVTTTVASARPSCNRHSMIPMLNQQRLVQELQLLTWNNWHSTC